MHDIPHPTESSPSDASLRAAIFTLAAGAGSLWLSLPRIPDFLLEVLTITLFLFVFVFLFIRKQFNKQSWFHSADASLPLWDRQGEVIQTDKLLENLPVALIRLNKSGNVEFSNLAARQLLGSEYLVGQPFTDLVEGLGRSMRERLREAVGKAAGRTTEMGRCMRNGQEVFLQVSLLQMSYVEGDCCIAVLSDKTELKTLEAQFVQSQKMEAVGQLAGGVAHDFNNLLTAINGHSDLLLLRHKSGDSDYGDLIQIRQNSIRAAALVRQLLAFSRKQTLRPNVVNLIDVLKELTQLLNRLLGEKVSLVIRDNVDLNPVRIDVRQFEQVIMNLVVNARDAMPDGGEVVICTENVTLDQILRRDRATVPAGQYVLVRVQDEGCGIDETTLPKIFEPFFTTKRVGEGTGLGLSTVYGIIKQTGGFIFVNSKKGAGTQFEIYLPIHTQLQTDVLPQKVESKQVSPEVQKGHILLVEDEIPVRSFASRALKLNGYTIDEAGSGEEALELLEKSGKPYDLIISDIIMPGKDGPTWVIEAMKSTPETKVIFMSGYSEDAFSEGKAQIEDAAFLAKPFSLSDLVEIVSDKLNCVGAS